MKKIISILICLIIILSFAACGGNNYIGIDKAKQTVVDDINAAMEDVDFAFNDLITDENGDYYRLKFTKDGIQYVYEVDAMTGKILNKNSNADTSKSQSTTTSGAAADNGSAVSDATTNNTDNLLDNNDESMMQDNSSSTTTM